MKKRIYHDSMMSYLVIEPETDIASSLSMNMMKNNKIQCLLDMECRHVDNNLALYYGIQGMQCIKEYIKEHSLGYGIARQFYADIAQAVLNGEEFFLNGNSYVMDLEYIFWDKKSKSVKLCCVPGLQGNFQEGIKKLTEELIECIDHNDKAAAVFIYGIYDLITDVGFVIPDVKDYIKKFCADTTNDVLHNIGRQENSLEKEQNKNYININTGIEDNTNKNFWEENNIKPGEDNGIDVTMLPAGEKNNGKTGSKRYGLCIIKSSLPFKVREKGDINIWIGSEGRQKGEKPLELNIGRSRECGFIIPVCYVSRHHAVLYVEDNCLYIMDLNSSNGTFVNEKKVPANVKTLCKANDVISFAGIKCRLTYR